jgi:8-amino-7-oxononanoate synthase
VNGREFVDFASNDYLGLATDPSVARAAAAFIETHGWGSAAAPLLTGYHQEHRRLEHELAEFMNAEAVVLFTSGYSANVGVLAALVGPHDVVFCEKRNHASLVDGCRLSRAKLVVYRSDRLDVLRRRLDATTGRRRLIVTESIFSMDGDTAPLAELVDIADRCDATLYVDEAHGIGVLGSHGRGAAEEQGVEGRIPLRLGTLGKAFGSFGAFVVTTRSWAQWLINRARAYLYSTGLPPGCAAASRQGLRLVQSEPQRRVRVKSLADDLRRQLASIGLPTGRSTTPIVPVIIGDSRQTIAVMERLRQAGIWTAGIRPPTVPHNTSRLRISLSAAHRECDLERLTAELAASMIENS